MKRLLLPLAVALAAIAGTARADTFDVVPTAAPLALARADQANVPGSVLIPAVLGAPPAVPQQLSLPELQSLWQRAGSAYGVPWQVLAAINKVESNFGRNMGPSSAGAVGWMQFMPSTWLRWGTDANGDGVADPWNAEDAVFSAARYLAAAGGATDVSRAVFAYNHAQWYVDEVLQLARFYSASGTGGAWTLDRLQTGLDQAKTDVLAANRRLLAAVREERHFRRLEERMLTRVERTALLSDRALLRKQMFGLHVRKEAAAALAASLREELAQAESTLASARDSATGAAFAAGASTVLSAPAYGDGYVFPVGGGAGQVTVSHTHHDYPAADIAAPEGSPVYALGNALVERAWSVPDERCGIGLTLRTSDGLTWTYCHLAYLEESVRAGSVLQAGAPVGLVGQTGHATGPHLHLQLQPPTEYPQQMSWFQRFAGTAFRWQEGGATEPSEPGRTLAVSAPRAVFAVVPDGATIPAEPVIAFTR